MKMNESNPITSDMVTEQLKTVIDPELGINIVDLGLVYDVLTDDEANVDVTMTLTSPMCPLMPLIDKEVKAALHNIPKVGEVNLELVWEPAWNTSMMSTEAKLQLGLPGAV